MGKFFKFLGWLIGILVLLILAAVIILPMVFDPNDYKPQLVQQVKQATGRDLTIQGDLGLSVFPWLGVETGALALSNADGFGEQPFAAVKQAAARVKLMPLFSKQLEVDTITLDGLKLSLSKSKDGRTNWDDLAAGAASSAEAESPSKEAGGHGQFVQQLRIGGIRVTDANLVWDDRSTGQHFTVEQFNLKSGKIVSGQPVELALNLLAKSKDPQVDAQLDLSGRMALDQVSSVLNISGLKATFDVAGENLPGKRVKAELEALIELALNEQTLRVQGLRLRSDELDLSGELSASGLGADPAFQGQLALAEFNLRQWLENHGIALPPMVDPNALSRFRAGLGVNGTPEAIQLSDLAIVLDDTHIQGTAAVRGSALDFKLNVDAIDVDRYLPPPPDNTQKGSPQGTASQPATAPKEEPPLLPVETLRGLDIDGVLTVGKLTINKLVAEEAELILKAKDGRLRLDQQVKKFYQGGYQGKLDLDVQKKTPLIRVGAAAKGIQIGPILKVLSGEDSLTGTGLFNADLTTHGNSVDAFKSALGGKLNFRFENGALKGINLPQMLREAKARFKGEALTTTNQPQQTDFSEISASASIKEGVIKNQDLVAKSPFLRVTGKGSANLVQESLDYTVTTVIVSTEKGQGGEGLEELKGVVVPVYLTGPFAAPEYKIDWAKILLESQKGELKQKLEKKLEEKLQKELKGRELPAGLQDTLKGLFN